VSCPICEKRKAVRFCPAKGETICAVCCATAREVTVDCPPDCAHLIAGHRYEDEHQRELPADTPLLDVKLPQDLININARQQLLAALAFSIAKFCSLQPAATDPDILIAIEALAQTYKTLSAGLIYEKPPAALLPRELYAALATLLTEIKTQQSGAGNTMSESEVFYLLVFLYRMGLLRTNGRPRSRRYIEFLRSQFPQVPELQRAEKRIIVP